MNAHPSLAGAGLLLSFVFLLPGGAQTAAKPADSGAVLHVETRRVIEDITVTDSHGKPVQDLTQSDFRIFEDGAEQKILSFEEHRQPTAAPVELPPLPANTYSNLSEPKAPGPLNVILYDLLSTAPEYQRYAHDQLVTFLKSRPPGRYAIFVLGNRLVLLQGFTANQDALMAAANSRYATIRPSYVDSPDTDIHEQSDKVAADLNPLDTVGAQAAELLAQMENNERDFRQDQEVEITLDAFTAIAQFLMPLPGRKNILWLSGSFPLAVLPETSDSNAYQSQRNYTADQKKVADLLNLSHTAVYAVDVRGLMNNTVFSASSRVDLRQHGGGGGIYNTPGSVNPAVHQQQRFAASQAAEHDTLTNIAAETGGAAFFNTNGLKEAFSKAALEGSDYYTLSYDPSDKKFDGRLRKIRVELSRHGYEVSYRRSYFADDMAGVAHEVDSLGVALQLGTPQIGDLPFLARLTAGKAAPATPEQLAALAKFQGAPEAKAVDVQAYAVDFAVLGRDLTLTPGENGSQHLMLEFAAMAYGPAGQSLNATRTRIQRTIPAEMVAETQKRGLPYRLQVDLPVTARYLRVGVRDNLSNRLGVVELPLPLAAQPAGAK
ncbi:MAG: VWA domain-containing protein [Terracidiphilus sp.]|jgi:VWFA-related protein